MRYADAGFIKQANNYINLELFNAGVVVLDLKIGNDICINKICYKKEQFNIEFLGYRYYDNFLSDIVLQKPIYNKKNMKKSNNGFYQNIFSKSLDIDYNVTKKSSIFKDNTHKIIIKIKKI